MWEVVGFVVGILLAVVFLMALPFTYLALDFVFRPIDRWYEYVERRWGL